ncbi:hypothetical protein AAK967_08915 [Atopobiaceae bacterium 24-176]
MAQLIDIQKVVVGPKDLTAMVRVAEGAPLMTSENVEATAHVYWLMPEIASHACLGDEGPTFQDVMGDTELAHLLEHVTVELLARTNMAGDIACGRTRATDDERTWEVSFPCPDDVLVTGALSSAAWILQWAYAGANPDTEPDVGAIVEGLTQLVQAAFAMADDEAVPAEDAEGDPEPAPDAPAEPEAQAEQPVADEEEAPAGEPL